MFLLSSLFTGPSFMSKSSMALELSQFSFIWDWPAIQKSRNQILISEFSPISGDWGEFEITSFALMSLMKCYWMLQNRQVWNAGARCQVQGVKVQGPGVMSAGSRCQGVRFQVPGSIPLVKARVNTFHRCSFLFSKYVTNTHARVQFGQLHHFSMGEHTAYSSL